MPKHCSTGPVSGSAIVAVTRKRLFEVPKISLSRRRCSRPFDLPATFPRLFVAVDYGRAEGVLPLAFFPAAGDRLGISL